MHAKMDIVRGRNCTIVTSTPWRWKSWEISCAIVARHEWICIYTGLEYVPTCGASSYNGNLLAQIVCCFLEEQGMSDLALKRILQSGDHDDHELFSKNVRYMRTIPGI